MAPAAGGVKVIKLVVSAPKGSKVSVKCTKHGCAAPRAFAVKKTQAFKPIGPVGPTAKAPEGVRMTAATGSGAVEASTVEAAPASFSPKTQVHAAKSFKLMKGKALKAGSKLIILVTEPGYIGKYFSYSIQRKAVSAKTISCTTPGSTTPRKHC
jgi:hypothetical protein